MPTTARCTNYIIGIYAVDFIHLLIIFSANEITDGLFRQEFLVFVP